MPFQSQSDYIGISFGISIQFKFIYVQMYGRRSDAMPMNGDITVDEDVMNYIISKNCDFRICTACLGPALVPISVKRPKESDLRIKIGSRMLYISRVQARYISNVNMDMLYDDDEIDSCPVFYGSN